MPAEPASGPARLPPMSMPGLRIRAFRADHWAIALPLSRLSAFFGSTFYARDEFPRDVLLEAILRYVGTFVPIAE